MDTAAVAHPPAWHPFPSYIPSTVIPSVPGAAHARIRFPATADYKAWLMGSTGRTLSVYVDGHRVGGARGVNTNGEWLPAGTVRVTRGMHDVELRRGHGSLRPGDRYAGWIGPLVFKADQARAAYYVPRRDARSLCRSGRIFDWIETRRS